MSEPFRWPGVVKLIHWSVVVLFFSNQFLFGGGSQYHTYAGWGILLLVCLRLLYGMTFAKTPARLRDICFSIKGVEHHLQELKEGNYQPHGHNPLGAMAVWFMWTMLLLCAFTGWLQDTDFGLEQGVYEWHSLLVNSLFYFTGIHLLAIVITSLFSRKNLVKSML